MIAEILIAQLALTSVRVIDGDTLHDNRRQHDYRLAGIDAPETRFAQCEAERERGEAAAQFVRETLDNATDIIATPSHDPRGRRRWPVDGFGRRIGNISIDGKDLGEMLVGAGFAVVRDDESPHDWCETG